MTQRDLAAVLFASLGVFIAVSAVPQVFSQVYILTQWEPGWEDGASPVSVRTFTIATIATSVLSVVAGGLLVVARRWLAERLFLASTSPLNSSEVLAPAFAVLGIYFVVRGLSNASLAGIVNWGQVAQAALGLVLFFGANSLARFWSAARSAGHAK